MPASEPIAALIAGTYADPETGELLRAESKLVAIEDSLDGAEVDLIEALVERGVRVAIVCDANTHAALGARVERALASRFVVQSVVLDHPIADEATVARLLAAIDPQAQLVIAVGSGTLNDLCKMAALARDVPQAVFATAPSMNGYTSVSASITDARGMKRSVRARTPAGVFFDLGVVAAAPVRLIRAGLGDSVCRPTAQVDWLLSHLLWGTPYREAPFALLADDEAALDPAGLVGGSREAVRRLARTLVLSGFGMTIAGGSFPASQGEHLVSHYIEMTQPRNIPHSLHGEHIAVATLALAAIQEAILGRDAPPRLRASTLTRADVIAHFGEALGEACWREVQPKLLDAARAEAANARLTIDWHSMRARLSAVSRGSAEIRAILDAAGAPTMPAHLGWPDPLFATALFRAREIRNRYTFLDLNADMVSA